MSTPEALSAHDHSEFVEGCYRCDLSRYELRDDFGRVEASRTDDGTIHIHRADDVIEVAGELAQMYGVKPPLDGRAQFTPDLAYDLSRWCGTYMDGRTPGTYIGRKVTP